METACFHALRVISKLIHSISLCKLFYYSWSGKAYLPWVSIKNSRQAARCRCQLQASNESVWLYILLALAPYQKEMSKVILSLPINKRLMLIQI